MTKPPVLKDWKDRIENELAKTGYAKEDILKILYQCEDYIEELQPAIKFVNEQSAFLGQILNLFRGMYATRFGSSPPSRPIEESLISEVLLDTPERRKQAIREVALSMTKPGDELSDEAVLNELKRRGMKLDAQNPTATISTILHGFKPQFTKVEGKGKRGVFKRQE